MKERFIQWLKEYFVVFCALLLIWFFCVFWISMTSIFGSNENIFSAILIFSILFFGLVLYPFFVCVAEWIIIETDKILPKPFLTKNGQLFANIADDKYSPRKGKFFFVDLIIAFFGGLISMSFFMASLGIVIGLTAGLGRLLNIEID